MMSSRISIPVGYSDCDALGRLKLSAFLRMCQELAEAHSESLGCGRAELMRERGLVWVITRNQCSVRRYPLAGEALTLETWTAPVRRVFYPRYFSLTDGNGEIVIESGTYWVLCDIKTRTMVNQPDVRGRDWDMNRAPVFERFMPFPEPIGVEAVSERLPVYSDMDINSHVNNTRYLDWLCDTLGTQALRERPIRDFLIDYHHEVREKQNVTLKLKKDEDCFTLTGHDKDALLFSVGGHFTSEGDI